MYRGAKDLVCTDIIKGEALHWWNAQLGSNALTTWQEFQTLFKKQYFLPYLFSKRTYDFLNLQQGLNIPTNDYMIQFDDAGFWGELEGGFTLMWKRDGSNIETQDLYVVRPC